MSSESTINFQPLFIVGHPRSGTTVMGRGLCEVNRIVGCREKPVEGHWLYLFDGLVGSITRARLNPASLLAGSDDREYLIESLRRVVVDQWLRAKNGEISRSEFLSGNGVFVDKTPGYAMISAVPAVLSLFPNAKFIFMYREPCKVMRSLQQVFGYKGNEEEFSEWWNRTTLRWASVKENIKAEAFVECHIGNVRSSIEKVGRLLALSDDELFQVSAYFATTKKHSSQTSGVISSPGQDIKEDLIEQMTARARQRLEWA
jgi:hypothetical protein